MGWPITHPSVIYAIRCRRTGRVYIGRTYRLDQRIKEHFSELRRGLKSICTYPGRTVSQFQSDYNKYGEESFDVWVIERDVPPERCKEREAYWISEYNSADPRFGYNRLDEKLKPRIPPYIEGTPPGRFIGSKKKRGSNDGEKS